MSADAFLRDRQAPAADEPDAAFRLFARAWQAVLIEPVDPFGKSRIRRFEGSPGSMTMDHLAIVEALDRFGRKHCSSFSSTLPTNCKAVYRDAITALEQHLATRDASASCNAIRALIVLTPEGDELKIDACVDFAGILSISFERKKPATRAGSVGYATNGDQSQVKLVAGVGFKIIAHVFENK